MKAERFSMRLQKVTVTYKVTVTSFTTAVQLLNSAFKVPVSNGLRHLPLQSPAPTT
jgi:hypothetical protein